jgi:hypothetical protein
VERGDCAISLRVLDAETEQPVASTVDLWRLDAPGNEHWTAGDQLQATADVPVEGARIEALPAGVYRPVCLAARYSAEDPPPVRVEGALTEVTFRILVPRKFDAHDPIKGRRSRDAGGYLGATAASKFYAEHQMKILSLDHANQLYWGEHGNWPKSHEEFMKNIVDFNKIVLPEIPEDEEYIYVPDQGEVGLQIRLRPGSPRSSLPAPAAGAAHVYQPPAEAPPTAATPVEGAAGEAPAEATTPEPSPSIRTRAEQLGVGRELPTE